ncbi:MAG TPA: DUF2934 domain-containing protein [Terriglobales bacterium]|nr:DUF2934 domain-containing protein [Terriglobales bacterium]
MARARTPRTTKPKAEKKILQMRETGGNNGNSLPADLESEIRTRAYLLYEQRGCTDGYAEQDWLTAEREVLARHAGPKQHTA